MVRKKGKVIRKISITYVCSWVTGALSCWLGESCVRFLSSFTKSRAIMNRKGANVSPCKTPASILKKLVLPSCVITWASVSRYMIHIAFTIFAGIPYPFNISISFPLCIESKALLKSTKVSTAGNCFAFIPSTSLLRVRIWDKVDLPARKPFWLSLSIGSMCGGILSSNILLKIFAAITVQGRKIFKGGNYLRKLR